MQLTKTLFLLSLLTLAASTTEPTPASKFPHGITHAVSGAGSEDAAPELKPRMPVGPAHHFYGKRQATTNSTISTVSTVTEAPTTTAPPTNNLTTTSHTEYTTTITGDDGSLQTVTSTRVVVPTGGEDKPTNTGPPGLATDAAGSLRVGWGGAVAVAGAAAWGAWVL